MIFTMTVEMSPLNNMYSSSKQSISVRFDGWMDGWIFGGRKRGIYTPVCVYIYIYIHIHMILTFPCFRTNGC